MEKSINQILDELNEAFSKAEKEFVKNNWYDNEILARHRCFVELIDMFGTWHKRGDCIQPIIDEWYKKVYLSR